MVRLSTSCWLIHFPQLSFPCSKLSNIAYSIYDGCYKANRPRMSVAPPVQLFHPAFGHFLDSVESKPALSNDIIHQTVEYMKATSVIHESEETCQRVLTPVLCAILDVNIQMILNEDKTNLDGIVEARKNMLHFLIFLQEDKNEFGDGSSDPSMQAGLSAGHCWVQSRVWQIHCIGFWPLICLFLSMKGFETLLPVRHFCYQWRVHGSWSSVLWSLMVWLSND